MSSFKTKASETFHTHLDSEFAFYAPKVVEKETKPFIVQTRDLSYRFHLHQHPYVKPLMQRLLRKGTNGLQAADTEYETRIRLANATAATDAFARPVQLAAGDLVYLANGAHGVVDGAAVRFAGSKVLKSLDESVLTPSAGKKATIPGKTQVRRSSGSVVTLDGDAAAVLVDGVPVPVLYSEIFSPAQYDPSPLVREPYPVKELDFTSEGAYAVYNWELFYHVPFTIAMHLSKNQRFPEAQRWFHYLFDPTDDSDGPTPERFWKVRPFQTTNVRKIEEILVNLATGADVALRNETIASIEAWKKAPFRPHVVARVRQQAYMYKTVMAYLDNLIDWGDALFRQDTGEAIDEALMLYVLAANILGPRPLPVPKKGTVRPQNYANLRDDLAQFGTVMRDVEAAMPIDLTPFPDAKTDDGDRLASLRSLGKALYFCVPRNDKLLGYWDTVADRLFKIRNSLNFQGVFRQLALFEPPIDPALLARAAAAGLDVGAILSGVNQPLPLVRFQLLVQKAAEIAQEVKSLGSSLLSAMEKEDGEAMALLRAQHERAVMEMVEHAKYGQLQEAIKSQEGLVQTLALAVQRYTYYERQLGRKPEEIAQATPGLNELDRDSLDKMKFVMQEPGMNPREVEIDIAQDLGASGGKIVSSHEFKELEASHSARDWQVRSSAMETAASLSHYLPTFDANLSFWGLGLDIAFGGQHVGPALSALAKYQQTLGAQDSYDASHAAKMATYQRREQDWAFQSNLAAGEIGQIFKQLRAAQIRVAVAELELNNHRKQIGHAKEIEQFLNAEGTEKTGKRTNKALYAWMKREVKGLYAQSFKFAFDVAYKAGRALGHELGNPEQSHLQFGYLSGKEGLLAGEKLYLDIKRMEMAYHDLNQREYELTKHVSLLQVDPLALIQLRATGRCALRVPEALFDLDGPGHYFRRIKSVGVSIPCVTGPYCGVNCTLTLTKSSIRKMSVLKGSVYGREDSEDDRFDDYYGSVQSIVASGGQNDSGMFDTNLRDERYLPFENAGVISDWQLRLPADPSRDEPTQFDYETVSDVILHVRFTAREGGQLLRDAAMKNVTDLIEAFNAAGSMRLFSVRHEFPSEWAKFQSRPVVAGKGFELKIQPRDEHYPYWSKGRLKNLSGIEVVARSPAPAGQPPIAIRDASAAAMGSLTFSTDDKLLRGRLTAGLPASPTSPLTMFIDTKAISDLWLAVTWGG